MIWMIFIKILIYAIQIKKNKILITSQDMMADKLGNRNLRPIKTQLFIRCRKLNNYLVLITQSYFPVPQKY